MNWIVAKRNITDHFVKIEVEAENIASQYQAGHHVVITEKPGNDPVAVVISGVNLQKGTISLLVSKTDKLLSSLFRLNVGDELHNVAGPYGIALQLPEGETVVCTALSGAVLPLLPVVKKLAEKNNRVIVLSNGATQKPWNELINTFSKYSEVIGVDPCFGESGHSPAFASSLQTLLSRENPQRVIAFGSVDSLKQSWAVVRRYNLPLQALIYSPIVVNGMLDGVYGVEMCNRTNYICVDGENFNAYYPNFEIMAERMKRSAAYANHQIVSV
jgi:NAD(P)H-flavin reductase